MRRAGVSSTTEAFHHPQMAAVKEHSSMENRSVTVMLALAVVVSVAGLVALGALALNGGNTSGSAAAPRQLSVSGSGEVKVEPDIATVQIGVETTAATSQAALQQNNSQAAAMIDQLKALGVAEVDIQTSGISIYPTYDETGSKVTGYAVSNSVSVTIRDLATAGDLLDKVVSAGANRVFGISFNVSDPAAALDEARAKAIADARARAEKMAADAGVSLGEILMIGDQGGSGVAPVYMDRAMAAGAGMPIQTGQSTISSSVSITFAIR
jgi:uncharacterized protein